MATRGYVPINSDTGKAESAYVSSGDTRTSIAIDTVLTDADTGKTFINNSANVAFTLPDAVNGATDVPWFRFLVGTGNFFLRINAPATQSIRRIGSATAVGGYMRSNTRASWVKLMANSNQWVVIEFGGTWLIDS